MHNMKYFQSTHKLLSLIAFASRRSTKFYKFRQETMGNPRNRARKPSWKRKATRCHAVDEKVTKISIEETQQSDAAVVRPKMSLNVETPL